MFDVLIIGGGVSSVSCALILGSAHKKTFAQDKNIAIITHQKASSLQEAIFYNAYGVNSGKLGSEILTETTTQLQENYPHLIQIEDEKVVSISGEADNFVVATNKNNYKTRLIVIGIGSSNLFSIEGL